MTNSAICADAAIVVCLGSGIAKDGSASETTRLRAEATIELCKALQSTDPNLTIILSGDGRKEKDPALRAKLPTEADIMAEILKEAGIAPERILLEDESRDTIGNAILTAVRYLREQTPRRLYVVTSEFHIKRALASFQGTLGDKWEIIPYACPTASDDEARGAKEQGGIDWTEAFFKGLVPGDLCAVVRTLLKKGKPAYRHIDRLKALLNQEQADTRESNSDQKK